MEPNKTAAGRAVARSGPPARHAAAGHRLGPALAARASVAGVCLVLSALAGTVAAPAASAAPRLVYAYAAGGATSPATCPLTAVVTKRCTLSQALALAGAGTTVKLVTPGRKGGYIGNWALSPIGTTSAAPLTIEPAAGVASPTLDGNGGSPKFCQTKTCDGPVLKVGPGVHVHLSGLSIIGAHNSGAGGAVQNDEGGTVTVTTCRFSGNVAAYGGAIANGHDGAGILSVSGSTFTSNRATVHGGAIDSADAGNGVVTVTASTFTANQAADGGAIDSAANTGKASLSVSTSTFTSNHATADGGAIDSADRGSGGLVVEGSTFSRNAAADGGAVDNADNGGKGSLTVSASTLWANAAGQDGGAIDNGDRGSSSLNVWASTLVANTASHHGGAVDNGDNGGASSVWAAADILYGTCGQYRGSWNDEGYNVASSATCTNGGKDDATNATALKPLANNGGATETMELPAGSPAVGIVPYGTTVSLNGATIKLCPTTDQRGVASPAGQHCNAGAVQS